MNVLITYMPDTSSTTTSPVVIAYDTLQEWKSMLMGRVTEETTIGVSLPDVWNSAKGRIKVGHHGARTILTRSVKQANGTVAFVGQLQFTLLTGGFVAIREIPKTSGDWPTNQLYALGPEPAPGVTMVEHPAVPPGTKLFAEDGDALGLGGRIQIRFGRRAARVHDAIQAAAAAAVMKKMADAAADEAVRDMDRARSRVDRELRKQAVAAAQLRKAKTRLQKPMAVLDEEPTVAAASSSKRLSLAEEEDTTVAAPRPVAAAAPRAHCHRRRHHRPSSSGDDEGDETVAAGPKPDATPAAVAAAIARAGASSDDDDGETTVLF